MSLLLDALKKQRDTAEQPGTAAGLTPEDPSKAKSSARPRTEAARNAGKNLFAAKTTPVRGRIQLGIIPIALIGGTVFASAYGVYLWYELTPHHSAAVRPAPPPHQAAPAPSHPAPPLALTPLAAPAEQPAESTAHSQQAAPAAARPEVAHVAVEADEPAPAMPEQRIHIENHQQSNSIDPLLSSAYQSYQQGDFATAQQQYVAALQQDPNNRDALLGIAALARQQGQDAIAAQYYRHILALDPRDPAAYAGMAALSNDDSPNAESRIKLLLAQQPQSATLNFALGNLYAGKQRWPEAQQAYFNAYNLQPGNADYAFNLAVSLDHLGQGKAAAEYYQRALQLGGTSETAGFDRKQVQQRLNALKAP